MGTYGRVRQATDDNIILPVPFACYIMLQTQLEYVTLIAENRPFLRLYVDACLVWEFRGKRLHGLLRFVVLAGLTSAMEGQRHAFNQPSEEESMTVRPGDLGGCVLELFPTKEQWFTQWNHPVHTTK